MIPLDDFNRWLPLMGESAQTYLSGSEYSDYSHLAENEVREQLERLLSRPISNFTVVNDIYFRARWGELLKKLHPSSGLKLLEIATGDADMIPQAMARSHPGSHYVTANMNMLLNKSLLARTEALPIKIELIADDAANIEKHLGQGTVDAIAFQHAVNDVLQAILCDREGIDTTYSDWMETLPKMISILQKETKAGTLEQHVKAPFLRLIGTLLRVLKRGGIIAMNHYMFQLDLGWGYPPHLFENMIPIVRQWLKELDGCEEIGLEGFEPHWWIFLRKV